MCWKCEDFFSVEKSKNDNYKKSQNTPEKFEKDEMDRENIAISRSKVSNLHTLNSVTYCR